MIRPQGESGTPEPSTVYRRVHRALRRLSPGYFAAVMATGIISIEMDAHGFMVISRIMLIMAAAAFVILIALNGWRFAAHRRELIEDLTHPLRSFGFYTFVAAANVLAVRLVASEHVVALILMLVATLTWLIRGYAVPWTTRLSAADRPILAHANGTWFVWAVGAHSVAVAASVLAPYDPGHWLPLIAVFAWCLGLFLYIVSGVLVVMRLVTFPFSAADLTAPYWVAMGAAAITALAGSKVATLPRGPFADLARPVIDPGAFFAWIIASWLLPALVTAGWWRHITHRLPLRYDSNVWSIIFPLGMYGMACTSIGQADHLPYLGEIGAVWVWVSFAAWLIAVLSGVQHIVKNVLL